VTEAPIPTPASEHVTDLDHVALQGISLAGFRKDHQHLSFVRFGAPESGKELLRKLAPLIANDTEVSRFNAVFSEIRKRRGNAELAERAISATWIGISISAAGYQILGVDITQNGLPPGESRDAFQAGMAGRASFIGDSDGDDPNTWVAGISGSHAVIVIASDSVDQMRENVGELEDLVYSCGCDITYAETGNTLDGELRGHEHFGFKDGISQPVVAGYGPTGDDPNAIAVGEFVLGFPDQAGQIATVGPLFTLGNFMVVRRLDQDVSTFRQQTAAGSTAASPPISSDQFAAKMVGRWPSGAPLELSPDADPGDAGVTNDFAYRASGDDDGHDVPQWAHIRKVNPRDETQPAPPEDSARHRMIRRGIPFETDDREKGLHFISFVADLVRQFEFVQHRWSDDPNFPNGGTPASPGSQYNPPVDGTPGAGPDPISGHHPEDAPVGYVPAAGATPQAIALLHQLIRMTGGEYFFTPSITALHQLGGGS
jgi:Dyp-type peroxidase family